jgi:hypothetical protein
VRAQNERRQGFEKFYAKRAGIKVIQTVIQLFEN